MTRQVVTEVTTALSEPPAFSFGARRAYDLRRERLRAAVDDRGAENAGKSRAM